MPDVTLMRRNRIERQFRKLEADCLSAFRAGAWLQSAILKESEHPWFANFKGGVTALASRRVEAGASAVSNEMREWSKRKGVAHLCLASGNALGEWLTERELHGFGLPGAILEPAWVNGAIMQSEKWARTIPGQVDHADTLRFHRDTF